MILEEQLKELILERYGSIREFARRVDMSNSTIDSILRRGVGNASIVKIVKICKALGISADELAEGKIVQVTNHTFVARHDLIEINDILSETKAQLIHNEDLTLSGKPVNQETITAIINGLEVTLEIVKKHNRTLTKTNKTEDILTES